MTTLDFGPYLERGFAFTPTLYEGPYETRGFIALAFRPGTADAVRSLAEGRPQSGWATSDGQGAALLERMYDAAQRLGADAVMQLSIQTTADNSGLVTFHLSGYAIKRGAEGGVRIEEVPVGAPPAAEPPADPEPDDQ